MNKIETEIVEWINNVVINLALCPFAKKPFTEQRVRIHVTIVESDEEILEQLQSELLYIDNNDNVETTLLVIENYLQDFYDFNQFLDLVDLLLEQEQWIGKYQIATFHPNYQFANTEPEDNENLTNRSPYPILHILSEKSMAKNLQSYSNPELIPQKNIEKMNTLTQQQKNQYFEYLFNNN